jgi:hypothetical protein
VRAVEAAAATRVTARSRGWADRLLTWAMQPAARAVEQASARQKAEKKRRDRESAPAEAVR